MLKTFISVFLAVAAVAAFGRTCTWKGGNGVWSSPDNWVDGVVPAGGYDVVIPSEASAITNENDIANLSLKSIRIEKGTGSGTVTINGQGLTLTGSLPFFSLVTTVVNVPLKYVSSCSVAVTNGCTGTFNQPITLVGAISFLQGSSAMVNDNGWFYYNSTVTGPEATITGDVNLRSQFNAPIHVYDIHGGYGSNFSPVFTSSDNHWKTNWVGQWSRMIASVKNAFPEEMVFTWRPAYYGANSNSSIYEFQKDQTCDRISCPTMPIYKGTFYNQYRLAGYNGSTLTLCGTASARCCARLEGTFNLVWNSAADCIQTFAGRTNTVTGTLTARRGTIALEDNVTFKNVTGITVDDGAVFSIAEGTVNPFTDNKPTLDMIGSGRIYVPANMTLKVKKLSVSGIPQPTNVTYTAVSAGGWLIGPGSVVASETDLAASTTYWAQPVDDLWLNAYRWTAGVPTLETNAFITATPGDYTVTISSAATAANLTIGSATDTATLLVSDESGSAPSLTLTAGKQLTVKSGGRLRMEGETSAITVGSATGNTGPNGLTVESGGEVHTTGGTLTLAYNRNGTNAGYPFGLNDSLAEFTDTEVVLKSHWTYTAGVNRTIRIGTGTLRLNGTTRVQIDSTEDAGSWVQYTYVYPVEHGGESRFEVLGDSAFTWNSYYFGVGDWLRGQSTLLIDTGYTGNLINSLSQVIGHGLGTAELLLRRGNVSFGAYGLLIGSTATALTDTSKAFTTGIVEICEGGSLTYSGHGCSSVSAQISWSGARSANTISGLLIGDGLASQNAQAYFRGELRMKGGKLEDMYAPMLVGTGPRGDGEVIHSGGSIVVMPYARYSGKPLSNAVAIAVFGGKGVYRMTGGEFSTLRPVYIGGASQEQLYRTITNVVLYAHQFHNANGLLSVSGGDFTVQNDMTLGSDGTGVLELTATGVVTAVGLTVSNTVGQAASELRFVSDEEGQFGTLNLQKLRFTEGSKIVIDATNFPKRGKTRTLFSLPNPVEGLDYIKNHVEIVNCPGGGHEKWSDDGCKLRFGMMKGFWIIVR